MPRLIILLLFISVLLTNCNTSKSRFSSQYNRILSRNDCQPSRKVYYYDSLVTTNVDYIVTSDSATEARFSKRTLNIASSIGLTELLNKFTYLENIANQGSDSAKLQLLFVRQEIDEKLTLEFLDISALLAEIDCDQQKMIEIRSFLQSIINRRVKYLNIGSIVTGSVFSVLSGGIAIGKPEANNLINATAITGAIVGGYLAIRQIFVNKSLTVIHVRNPLGDLWYMPSQSKIFPPNIWYYLTLPPMNGEDSLSKREVLINEFDDTGILGAKDSKERVDKVKLFFGEGGQYDVDHLTDRINMLEMLETKINFMKYDLKRLQQEVLIEERE